MARSRLYAVVMLGSFLSVVGLAQTPQDPLLGEYVLGNSAEMVLVQPDGNIPSSLAQYFYDCTPGLDSVSHFLLADSTALGEFSVDVAMADVDNDGKEEAGVVCRSTDGSLLLTISRFTRGQLGLADRTVTPIPGSAVQGGVRILRGSFDTDPAEEFLAAYRGVDGALRLMIVDVDSASVRPTIQSEIAVDSLPNSLGVEALFDVAVGDFDRDGLDEVCLAKVWGSSWAWISGTDVRMSTRMTARAYDYDPFTGQFSYTDPGWFELSTGFDSGIPDFLLTGPRDVRIDGVVVTAGDFTNDGVEEIFMGFLFGLVVDYGSSVSISYGELAGHCLRVSGDFGKVETLGMITCEQNIQLLATHLASWGHWSLSAASADLNGDGSAELVTGGFRNLSVFTSNSLGRFTKSLGASMTYPAAYQASASHRMLAIGDVDADTNASRWIPEILVASSGRVGGGAQGTVNWRLFGVNVDSLTLAFKGLSLKGSGTVLGRRFGSEKWAIAMGDANGDAIRVRNPRLIVQESILQPLVILNALPIHFDVLGGTPYDVCKSYNQNPGSFTASYEQQSGQTVQFSTEVKSDWGVSSTVSAGGSFLGFGVNAHLTTKYGEGFSKKRETSKSVTVTERAVTRDDDYICATVTDYEFWEYPLYSMGEPRGNVLVVIPRLQSPPTRWMSGKSWEAMWHRPRHEVGNILSYLPAGGAPFESDVETLLHLFTPAQASQKAGMDWMISFDEFMSSSDMVSKEIGFEAGLSVSGWGFEVSVNSHYNREELSTHTSSATNGVRVGLHVDEIDKSLGEVEYTIGPCVYWAKNGALVVDYTVTPSTSSGGGLETWWEERYGHLPDPAFNLPWRLDPEKGYTLTNPEKRWLSKSIRVSPSAAREGEKVHIRARVHNFSLVPLTRPVVVRFFIGNPDSGGTPIVGDGGVTELRTIGTIGARDYQNMQMGWTVPPGLSTNTRIYGLIDPDDSTSEIHEDNNIGFTEFSNLGTTAVGPSPDNQIPERYALFQNYPNPFNPSTVIRYALPTQTPVSLKVYDVLGREIVTLVEGRQSPGIYSIWFNGAHYATGMYFYRLQAGTFSETRRLLLIK